MENYNEGGSMSWENIIKEAECKIRICESTDCKHNENKRCTLDRVNLGVKANCLSYVSEAAKPRIPTPKENFRNNMNSLMGYKIPKKE